VDEVELGRERGGVGREGGGEWGRVRVRVRVRGVVEQMREGMKKLV
jgi:hypothetical protein